MVRNHLVGRETIIQLMYTGEDSTSPFSKQAWFICELDLNFNERDDDSYSK